MAAPVSTILDEIRQTRPFATPAAEGVVSLLRTAAGLRRVLAAVVETRGITLQQYNVLRILRGAGGDGLPTLEISDRMVFEHAPGITRLLDRLERKKLVRRARCARDRRRVLCRITGAGRRVLAALDRPVDRASGSLIESLGKARTRDLVRLLDAVRAAFPGNGKRHSPNKKEKMTHDR